MNNDSGFSALSEALASVNFNTKVESEYRLKYPTFTHMKGAINGWNPHMDWRDSVRWTLTNNFDFIVGGYAQHYPFHYFQKTFCTEELVDRYEQRLGI
jgi:hypothetical protein